MYNNHVNPPTKGPATIYEMYPPVYVFHDIGPKRWNVLLSLLDLLFERYGSVRMLEIGVDL